jgi:hypothetical protein
VGQEEADVVDAVAGGDATADPAVPHAVLPAAALGVRFTGQLVKRRLGPGQVPFSTSVGG